MRLHRRSCSMLDLLAHALETAQRGLGTLQ
jgi:hypothetical protein